MVAWWPTGCFHCVISPEWTLICSLSLPLPICHVLASVDLLNGLHSTWHLTQHRLLFRKSCYRKRSPQVGPVVKNPPVGAGDTRDTALILGLGRTLGVGNDSPLQYSCLENYVDRGIWQATVHGVTKSWTRPSVHAIKVGNVLMHVSLLVFFVVPQFQQAAAF